MTYGELIKRLGEIEAEESKIVTKALELKRWLDERYGTEYCPTFSQGIVISLVPSINAERRRIKKACTAYGRMDSKAECDPEIFDRFIHALESFRATLQAAEHHKLDR